MPAPGCWPQRAQRWPRVTPPPLLWFPDPQTQRSEKTRVSWRGETRNHKQGPGGDGLCELEEFSVPSVANNAVPHLHAVEVPNVPIDDRTAKHERDRRRGGEKDTKRHQAISFAEVERYEYQRAEQRAAENGE